MAPSLAVSIAGLGMKNPALLASGIWGETAASMVRAAGKGGAGGVVTKSISMQPRAGYPNPTVAEVEGGFLNAIGLANPGMEAYAEEMKEAVAGLKGAPLIGSIFAPASEEYITLARAMERAGASALELNLGCPHAKGYGAEQCADTVLVEDITRAAVGAVRIPVFVKISPMVPSVAEVAKAVKNGGGAGVVAINTIRALALDLELESPVLANRVGGLSGQAIKPVGLRCVYEISSAVDIPVIGVGGISTGGDAAEYILCGASAVQIGSAVVSRGITVFRDVGRELKKIMERKGYRTIDEMRGRAVRR